MLILYTYITEKLFNTRNGSNQVWEDLLHGFNHCKSHPLTSNLAAMS